MERMDGHTLIVIIPNGPSFVLILKLAFVISKIQEILIHALNLDPNKTSCLPVLFCLTQFLPPTPLFDFC